MLLPKCLFILQKDAAQPLVYTKEAGWDQDEEMWSEPLHHVPSEGPGQASLDHGLQPEHLRNVF